MSASGEKRRNKDGGRNDWRTLQGLSHYPITNDGRVLSMWKGSPVELSGGIDKDGYRKYVLIDDNGSRRYVRRCSMVCEAFHGPRPDGAVVRHHDGTRQNDDPRNLSWADQKTNLADRIEHGTAPRGERSVKARITTAQAGEIKRALAEGGNPRDIARRIGCTAGTVFAIRYGLSWRWLSA